jgi:endonuclease/exonuclease/phosphatase family metal-dependent hydrolase
MNATASHVHRHLFERGSGFALRSLLVVCLTILLLSGALDEPVLAQDTTPSTPALKKADESVPVEIRFGRAVPLPKGPKTIRIAAYNVLNLFDPVDDPTLSGKYDDLPMATSRDRCLAIAKVIKAIDADVLALEEVESKEAIEWFRDEFLQGLGYDHVASLDVGYYRGVEQSVLSRFPISGVTAWPDESLADMAAKKTGDGWETKGDAPTSFQRSPLMVDIEVPASSDRPAYSFTLAVVHHKSGNFKKQRESEALQLVELLQSRLEEEPELNLIVLGDFNAGPFDQSIAVYKNAGFVNAYEHRWSREAGTRNLFRTHESDRVIDYIMLHPNADSEVAKNTFQVVGSLHPGDKYNWRKDDPPSGYAADHYPLVIDVRPVESKPSKSR